MSIQPTPQNKNLLLKHGRFLKPPQIVRQNIGKTINNINPDTFICQGRVINATRQNFSQVGGILRPNQNNDAEMVNQNKKVLLQSIMMMSDPFSIITQQHLDNFFHTIKDHQSDYAPQYFIDDFNQKTHIISTDTNLSNETIQANIINAIKRVKDNDEDLSDAALGVICSTVEHYSPIINSLTLPNINDAFKPTLNNAENLLEIMLESLDVNLDYIFRLAAKAKDSRNQPVISDDYILAQFQNNDLGISPSGEEVQIELLDALLPLQRVQTSVRLSQGLNSALENLANNRSMANYISGFERLSDELMEVLNPNRPSALPDPNPN